jgi:hypothetical protein
MERLSEATKAAEASTVSSYTAHYRTFGSTVESTYAQKPPSAVFVVTGLADSGVQTLTTRVSSSILCTTVQVKKCRTVTWESALTGFRSPRQSVGLLKALRKAINQGKSLSVSSAAIAGFQATCFAGPATGFAEGKECFTPAGILALLAPRSDVGVELTGYSPLVDASLFDS